MNYRESIYLECECGGNDHNLRFVVDKEDGDVYIDMALNHYLGFWKRLKLGIKYTFGYHSRYGYFTELVTTKQKLVEILRLIESIPVVKETNND